MVKAKSKIRRVEVQGPDWESEKIPDEQVDQEDVEMEQISRGMPGGVRCVKLFRMQSGPAGGRPKFVAELPKEAFTESSIQQVYGGGSYFARWEKKNGQMLRYTFDIEGPEKIIDVPSQEEPEPEPQPATVIDPSSMMNPFMLIKMMQEAEDRGARRTEKMMEMFFKSQSPQHPDVTKQVFDIVEKIAPMIGGGSGEGSSVWFQLATTFKEPLSKLMDTIQTALNRPAPVQAAPPVKTALPTTPVKPAEPPAPNEGDMLKFVLKQYIPIFVNAAAKNAEHETYVNMILDQVPESLYPALNDFLKKSTCLDELADLEPGIRFQQEWWMTLRQIVVEQLDSGNGAVSVQPDSAPSESLEDR